VFATPEGAVWLATAAGEPLLAGGRHGLGRAVVFASAPEADGGAWAREPAARLLEESLRWALRPPGTPAVEVTARRIAGGRVRVVVLVPSGTESPDRIAAEGAELRRVSPSRWEGEVAAPGETVAVAAGGAPLARAAISPAPAAEDAALGPDPAALAALELPAGPDPGSGERGAAGLAASVLALAALALLLAAALREVPSRGPRPSKTSWGTVCRDEEEGPP